MLLAELPNIGERGQAPQGGVLVSCQSFTHTHRSRSPRSPSGAAKRLSHRVVLVVAETGQPDAPPPAALAFLVRRRGPNGHLLAAVRASCNAGYSTCASGVFATPTGHDIPVPPSPAVAVGVLSKVLLVSACGVELERRQGRDNGTYWAAGTPLAISNRAIAS
ncbi:MAG: hypothetical protein QOC82_2760 [Frankiaceae bacterium]|jgi:hypothetical protein|nr:hypothetical protein [Frankiaceae bacterium]